MDKQADDDLSSRLGRYVVEPDERLWSSIKARLEESRKATRLKRRTRTGWIIALTLVTLGSVNFFINFKVDTQSAKERSPTERVLKNEVQGNVPPSSGSEQSSGSHFKSNKVHVSPSAQQGSFPRLVSPSNIAAMISSTGRITDITDTDDPLLQVKHETMLQAVGVTLSDSISEPTFIAPPVEPSTAKKNREPPKVEEKNRKRRFGNVYFTVMPTLGYQRIEANANDNLLVESIERLATFSMNRLGVRVELGLESPIAPRINAFGGLIYFQRNQTIGYTEKQVSGSHLITGPNGEIINVPEFIFVGKTFDYNVRNVGMQLGANYHWNKRRFLNTLGAGIEFHVALNKWRQSNPEFTNNPSVYVFYNIYYRLQYPADTKLRAIFQPTLNYSFYINQDRNAPFYVKPYGLGLNLGFTYNLW